MRVSSGVDAVQHAAAPSRTSPAVQTPPLILQNSLPTGRCDHSRRERRRRRFLVLARAHRRFEAVAARSETEREPGSRLRRRGGAGPGVAWALGWALGYLTSIKHSCAVCSSGGTKANTRSIPRCMTKRRAIAMCKIFAFCLPRRVLAREQPIEGRRGRSGIISIMVDFSPKGAFASVPISSNICHLVESWQILNKSSRVVYTRHEKWCLVASTIQSTTQ